MRKILMALGFVAICGVAIAAVQVHDGTSNMGVTEDIIFTGASVSASNAALAVNTLLSSQDLDTALYTSTRGTGGQRALCVAIDGKIYASTNACM
jgi:hypothetical protein